MITFLEQLEKLANNLKSNLLHGHAFFFFEKDTHKKEEPQNMKEIFIRGIFNKFPEPICTIWMNLYIATVPNKNEQFWLK